MMISPPGTNFFVSVLLAGLLAWVIARLASFARFYYLLFKIPSASHLRYHWLLGNLPDVVDRPRYFHETVPKFSAAERRLYRFMVGPIPFLVVNHADLVAAVLKSSPPKNLFTYSLIMPFIGDGLLVSSGKKWARDRRLLTNAFHFNILQEYTPILHDSCQVLLDKLAQHVSDGEMQSRAFDFSQACRLLTLDVMLRCIMAHESNCQLEDSQYTRDVREITRLIMVRGLSIECLLPDSVYFMMKNGKQLREVCDRCHDFSASVIKKRRNELQECGPLSEAGLADAQQKIRKGRASFVDILLTVRDEDGSGLSDSEIRDQVDTFLFEGHDTTSSGLQWLFYYLAKDPAIQQQCREEAQRYADDGAGHVGHKDLAKLTFITQCIKEALRMACPVAYIERRLSQEIQLDQYTIPKGSIVNMDIFALHHSEDFYPDAYTFKPDRFSEEAVAARNLHAFIPFSAGSRNCIGQALAMNVLRAAVSSILLHVRLSIDPSLPEPMFEDAVVMQAKNGINLLVSSI
eukprot:scpid55744/ scgid25077/ Cytochrome P450 4F1; CYPIVF1; Cytochrome P450-A3